ncbi:hypothetical protein EBQ74_06700 [bacterium]|nr:hypothetical protein [bacterium]
MGTVEMKTFDVAAGGAGGRATTPTAPEIVALPVLVIVDGDDWAFNTPRAWVAGMAARDKQMKILLKNGGVHPFYFTSFG